MHHHAGNKQKVLKKRKVFFVYIYCLLPTLWPLTPNISKQQEKSQSWRVRMKVEEFYPLPFFFALHGNFSVFILVMCLWTSS